MFSLSPFLCIYGIPFVWVRLFDFEMVETSEVKCKPGHILVFSGFEPSDRLRNSIFFSNQKVINFELCDHIRILIQKSLNQGFQNLTII